MLPGQPESSPNVPKPDQLDQVARGRVPKAGTSPSKRADFTVSGVKAFAFFGEAKARRFDVGEDRFIDGRVGGDQASGEGEGAL